MRARCLLGGVELARRALSVREDTEVGDIDLRGRIQVCELALLGAGLEKLSGEVAWSLPGARAETKVGIDGPLVRILAPSLPIDVAVRPRGYRHARLANVGARGELVLEPPLSIRLVLHTDGGMWTISENGVGVDNYAPEASRIPGVRRFARFYEVEVVLNGNTREHSLDQYTSMILEKGLSDPSRARPEFPQHFSSSEMVSHPLAPGLAPTMGHGSITHGEVQQGDAKASAAA